MTSTPSAIKAHAMAHNPAVTPSNPSPATFTPGPWRVSGDQIQCERINAYGNFIICEIRRDMTGEDCANARLIAAAPELLAALENIAHLAKSMVVTVGMIRRQRSIAGDIEQQARAAIQKATQI